MTWLDAAIVAVGTIIGAALAYTGGRYAVRQSLRANRDGDSAEWERRYRAGAEAHMPWDYQMRSNVLHLQVSVNGLRVQLGMEPETFAQIGEAPPLFPHPPERKN